MNTEYKSTIEVSPWLVKMLAGCILGGLGAIGSYMIVWNSTDSAFKVEMRNSLITIKEDIRGIEDTLKVVPSNTQKIINVERRMERVEAEHDAQAIGRRGK